MKAQSERLRQAISSSQLYRSVFRHDYVDSLRNRALEITSNVFLHLHPVTIPRHALAVRFTFCLGGLTFFLFLVETVTGLLLMFYYRPVPDYAYMDMKTLEYAAQFGIVLRNLHRWGAHLMVITVMLHMLRVFLTGSYRPPREFNWVIGVSLLVMTLLLSFTGYLLPWDQLAFWAVTVGTNMAAATPFVGAEGPFHELLGMHSLNDVRFLLLGDMKVGANALLRFYVLHCVGLPLAAIVAMMVHFWRVRKDGGISRPL
ncbi:MAG TPA: cytochrome b N-terminal domain-containing protein [Candidatus Acidoferrales bacterium]|nr:cytochrome b N-terminal domain-containing protein [Candidatus Acidoferrales bacterium]